MPRFSLSTLATQAKRRKDSLTLAAQLDKRKIPYRQLAEFHFRVRERLDVYPSPRGRSSFHDILTGEPWRRIYDSPIEFIERFFKTRENEQPKASRQQSIKNLQALGWPH